MTDSGPTAKPETRAPRVSGRSGLDDPIDVRAAQSIVDKLGEQPDCKILVVTATKTSLETVQRLVQPLVHENKWAMPTFATQPPANDEEKAYDWVVVHRMAVMSTDLVEACLVPPITDPEALALIATNRSGDERSSEKDPDRTWTVMEEID